MNRMKLFLKALAFCASFAFLTEAKGMESNKDIVEMYSDEMPKVQMVLKGDVPQSCYQEFSPTLKWHTREKTLKYLKEVFKKEKREECPLDGEVWQDIARNNFLFVSCEETSIFLDLHYEKEYLTPVFQALPMRIHDSVFHKDKWDYPKKIYYWNGIEENVNEMSWKYIDIILHSEGNLNYQTTYFPERPVQKKIFDIIKEKGLENSLLRGVLVFNKNNQYCWNVVYNTEKQKEQGEFLISKIKKYF